MRNVIEDIEIALRRGCSPFTLEDVLKAQQYGNLHVIIGTHMSGSWWERLGQLEVVHLAGKWDDGEGRTMMEAFKAEAARRGIPFVIQGRKGWSRFLKMKGLL